VPDLVGLVGAAKAEVVLREALRKRVSLSVAEGEATRELARKVALAEIVRLRMPQWQLVDGIGTWQLYEAMLKRFDPAASANKSSVSDGGRDYTRVNADIYYMIDMIIAGRQTEAERALRRAAGAGNLTIPKEAVRALVQ